MDLFKRYFIHIVALSAAIVLMASCRSAGPCPAVPSAGNLGSEVNSGADDYIATSNGNTLYFTSKRDKKKEGIYASEYDNGEFLRAELDTTLPLARYSNISTPTFYRNPADGVVEMYFAATTKRNRNKEIYTTRQINGQWSEPKPIEELSSDAFDSHPCIAPDGSFIVFSSMRDGGVGGLDLYVSYRNGKNSWSKPVNLGPGVNTQADDITPCIAPDKSLYFASKGYTTGTGYDIIKAEYDGKKSWNKAKDLPIPLNSAADDSGPTIIANNLCFASKRGGGCGGFDIYAFPLCGPVIVDGTLDSRINISDLGYVELYSRDGRKLEESRVNDNFKFEFVVEPNKPYVMKYKNDCLHPLMDNIAFTAPCSDTSTVKLLAKFVLSSDVSTYTFDEFRVPFFVTGYYMPNTSENLASLRLKFSLGMMNDESKKYIENPGPEYDETSQVVDGGFRESVRFIMNTLRNMDNSCLKGNASINVKVLGYSDPRPISDKAIYDGPDVDAQEIGLVAKHGERITNDLLSRLRAYFSAELIKKMLNEIPEFEEYRGRVTWSAEGMGVDESPDANNELKRKVIIRIGLR